MTQGSSGIYASSQLEAVEDWFQGLVTANALLLEETNQLVFTACDGSAVTPNEKIRRLELLNACVRHNVHLAIRGEKLRAEIFKDPPACLEKYQAYVQNCEKQLLAISKPGI